MLDIDGNKNYFVSEGGRVFSAKRKIFRELHTWKNRGGYLKTKIYNKSESVHRLVASVFVENPLELETVDHIDGDKLNNHYTNLRWMTREENAGRAGRGTYMLVSPFGCVVQVTGLSEFCKENNLTQANMSKVIMGQRSHHKNWTRYE